jgi:hypothetical protein
MGNAVLPVKSLALQTKAAVGLEMPSNGQIPGLREKIFALTK